MKSPLSIFLTKKNIFYICIYLHTYTYSLLNLIYQINHQFPPHPSLIHRVKQKKSTALVSCAGSLTFNLQHFEILSSLAFQI